MAMVMAAPLYKRDNHACLALAVKRFLWNMTGMAMRYSDAASALDGVLFDGMTVMVGGFGMVGSPEKLLAALVAARVSGLTVIANSCGTETTGVGPLIANGQVKKLIASYVGGNAQFEKLYHAGKLELELSPQGTLAERIRAGGAGIPAFYTPTGVGTVVAEGKHVQDFDGRAYLRETWLKADLALIRAHRGDTTGNLVFRKTARNFNPQMATAGKCTIAEVEALVEPGVLDAEMIHTPGIYVDRIFQGADYARDVEIRTVRER